MTHVRRDQVLIITDVFDPHVDLILPLLERSECEPVRLNTSEIPARTALSFRLDSSSWCARIGISSSGRVVDAERVRSVWWRRPGEFRFPKDLSPQERCFAERETDLALRGVWGSLDCYWMSNPDDIRRAARKVEQLTRASGMGFDVPRTVVTTSAAEVRAFYDECGGKVVFKVLSDPSMAANDAVRAGAAPADLVEGGLTALVTADLLADLEADLLVPCQFQEYVEKDHELRVTMVGDELFTVAIESQAHEGTRLDWRAGVDQVVCRSATLPDEVEARCFAFAQSYGLTFSAMDLVVTPDGRYVFLENNPAGQFLFLEARVPELRMSAAVAACLTRGASA